MGQKSNSTLKTSALALMLSLLTGNALAAPNCTAPQDMAALRTAALQQQLMVAAFACNDMKKYNRFVTSYKGELQKSDRVLLNFFVRQSAGSGTDNYDIYKTKLANDASLLSMRNPQFCRSADAAFGVAFSRKMPLTELVSERLSPLKTGYTGCVGGKRETTLAMEAPRNLPVRQAARSERRPMTPYVSPDVALHPDHVLPVRPPQPSQQLASDRVLPTLPPQPVTDVASLPLEEGAAAQGSELASESLDLNASNRDMYPELADKGGVEGESARYAEAASARAEDAVAPNYSEEFPTPDSPASNAYESDAELADRESFVDESPRYADATPREVETVAPRYSEEYPVSESSDSLVSQADDRDLYAGNVDERDYARAGMPEENTRYADAGSQNMRAYDPSPDSYRDNAVDNYSDGYDDRLNANLPSDEQISAPPEHEMLVRGTNGRLYVLTPYGL